MQRFKRLLSCLSLFVLLSLILVNLNHSGRVFASANSSQTFSQSLLASKPTPLIQSEAVGPVTVGEHVSLNLELDYQTEASWIQTIHHPDAAYIKVHFQQMQLLPGDYVTVSDPSGEQAYTYPKVSDYTIDAEGKGFWAISILGDTAVIQLHTTSPENFDTMENVAQYGVVVDKYARGFSPAEIEEQSQIGSTESTCGSNERIDAVCYETSHPTEYGNSNAVVRLLINGSSLCTGWRASEQNRIITNEHCVSSQSDVNSVEVWFDYQRLTCGGTINPTVPIVTGDTLLVDDYTHDVAVFTVNNFASIQSYGYLDFDVRAPILDEEIYIPQHGAGNPREFGIESDMNSGNVCRIDDAVRDGRGADTDTGYFCDTTGGSSGSPVLARSSHQVIALHHFGTGSASCGGNTMNAGVRIDEIWPIIAPYFTAASGDVFEPDDSANDATQIDDGAAQVHSIVPVGDEDWVTFSLSGETAVTLETDGPANSDTRMWLYDSNLNELEYDDDSGTDLYSRIDRVCGVDALPAGDYFVKVDEFGDNDEIAEYSISYTIQEVCSGVNIDFEPDGYQVDDDNNNQSSGNNDGVMNSGESVELFFTLANTGTSTASDVNACISEDSPYVADLGYNTCSDYGDIPAGGTGQNSNDFDFSIDPNTPNGHVVNFTLDVTAGNSNDTWSVIYSIPVFTDDVVTVGLISDQDELSAITTLLDSMGNYAYTLLNDNWDGVQGVYTSDLNLLGQYDMIIWYASGYGYGRTITQSEYDTMESYLQAGGRLLVTGYDTIGHPSDDRLADLIRSSSYGDGPFTYDYTVTNSNHPIMDGPYGTFATGTPFVAAHSDHDQAEADTSRGAVTVAELDGGADKIVATELSSDGRVVYWNGNRDVLDWQSTDAASERTVLEIKRDEAEAQKQPQRSPEAVESQQNIFKNTVYWLGEALAAQDDHGNDPSTCTPIFYGTPVLNAVIDPPGDWDYFCFDGSAGQVISADVDAAQFGSSLDPVLTLYDTDGVTILIQNDDANGLDSYLEYTLPTDGVYFLSVRSFADPCCGSPNHVYDLLLEDITPSISAPWSDDMEGGPNLWTANGLWHQVDGNNPYGVSHSPSHSWWYGQDATGDYDTGGTNSGSLTTPRIQLPANASGATLTFWSWYQTEANTNYDLRQVQISVDGSPYQLLNQLSGDAAESWVEHTFDLSAYIGSEVQIRFVFDTVDSVLNDYQGWYIDDVAISLPGSDVELIVEDVTIDDDNVGQSAGNGNGIVEPGETIEMLITLRNIGSATAQNVQLCMVENSPYVNGFEFNDCSQLPDIPPGGTAVINDDFDFYVDSATPPGHVINMNGTVTADGGYSTSFGLSITVGNNPLVVGPVVYFSHNVDDDNTNQSVGNGDGVPNPGETIELYVEMENTGTGVAENVEVCITHDSPQYVSDPLYNGCAPYGDIFGGSTAINGDDFDFSIDPTTPHGHVINFTLTATAGNSGDTWTSDFSMQVVTNTPILYFVPQNQTASLYGGSVFVDVVIQNVVDLGAYEFAFNFDPNVVEVVNIAPGPFLGSTGRNVLVVADDIDNNVGEAVFAVASTGTAAGPNGTGVLATIEMNPVNVGDSNLLLDDIQLANTEGDPIYSPDATGNVLINDNFFADVDGDGDVDISDIQRVANRFGCAIGDTCYDAVYDLNNNGIIHLSDIQIVACYWGWPNGDFSSCYTPASQPNAIVEANETNVWLATDTQAIENVGDTFTVTVEIENAVDVGAFGFDFIFDPALVEVNSIDWGSFLDGRSVIPVVNDIDNANGEAEFQVATIGTPGADGSGALATIVLTSRTAGSGLLALQNLELVSSGGVTQTEPNVQNLKVSIALPFLLITMGANANAIAPGGELTYLITVENLSQSNPATDVEVVSNVPNLTSFVSANSGGVLQTDSDQVQWSGQSVPGGGVLTVQYTIQLDADYPSIALVNNSYSVNSAEGVSATGEPVSTQVGFKLYLPLVSK